MKEQLSFTVGIPTCYGGESLVATAKSLRASVNVGKFRLIIVADRTPITAKVKKQLKNMDVELYWNEVPGCSTKKLIRMVSMLSTDIFVYTQDDIIFDPKALGIIMSAFAQDPDMTMASTSILPLPAETFFESLIARMLYIVRGIGINWKNADNHLLASGRCLAFRTEALKQYKLVEGLVNCDMYQYLENKSIGGKFKFLYDAEVYIRCPTTLKEQMRPSSKYQYSYEELQPYFENDISKEYEIPFWAYMKGFGGQLLTHPISSILYVGVFVYTRTYKLTSSKVLNPLLGVDMSTKKTI